MRISSNTAWLSFALSKLLVLNKVSPAKVGTRVIPFIEQVAFGQVQVNAIDLATCSAPAARNATFFFAGMADDTADVFAANFVGTGSLVAADHLRQHPHAAAS